MEISIGASGTYFILFRNEKLCNFNLVVKKAIHLYDTNSNFIRDEVKLHLLTEKQTHKIRLPLTEIRKNSDWINQIPGMYIQPIKGGYSYLVQLMNEATESCESENIIYIDQTGWFKYHKKYYFAHGGGVIPELDDKYLISDNIKDIVIETKYSFEDPEDVFEKMVKHFKICPSICMVLVSFLILSIMKSLLESKGIILNMILFLEGSTGTFKTTISSNFLCFANRKEYGVIQPQTRLNSTKRSILEGMHHWRDFPYIIDDLEPSEREYFRMKAEETVSEVIRIVGDNNGRRTYDIHKNNINTLQPNAAPCITGEYFISNQSSIARTINLKVKKGDIDSKKLSKLQNDPFLIPTFAKSIIKYISKNHKTILNYAVKLQKKSRKKYQTKIHAKTNDAISMLYLGFKIFADYGLDAEVLKDKKDKKKFIKKFSKILTQISAEQETLVTNKAPLIMFKSTIREMYDAKALSLQEFGKENQKHHCGWQDDEHYYFIPRLIYGDIFSFLRKQNETFTLKYDRFMQMIKEAEISNFDTDGKPSKHNVFDDKRMRVLKIDKSLFT